MGDHPAANAFVRPENLDKPDMLFPLESHACLDCGLIQIPDPLPADFYVDYVYMPSATTTMPAHFAALARQFREELVEAPGQLVVDIGSNDGLLLAACLAEGMRVLGVDPSENISEFAREKGVEVFNEYFTAESSVRIREQYGPARVIVSTNTLNHIDNLDDFMAGVATLLEPEGSFVLELPQALTCIEFNEFDTVYHEHLSTFSAASLVALGKKFGFKLVDLEELPIHGGSMRCILSRVGEPSTAVSAYLEGERAAGLFTKEAYDRHVERVHAIRSELLGLLERLKAEGKKLAGYSAPAKGNTLLNYFRIGPDTLDWIADRNELKQGRYTPGMRIPVVSPDRIAKDKPDYLLILAWNFRDEIVQQQADYLAGGGKFIVPIPRVEIIGD
jgi:SAM-dependent methyltransferase